jgi:hypothetical protein
LFEIAERRVFLFKPHCGGYAPEVWTEAQTVKFAAVLSSCEKRR